MKLEDYKWYTPRAMRRLLEPYRGKKIPASTMRYWRAVLDMRPNENGMYSQDDLQILLGAIAWLDSERPLREYANLISQGHRITDVTPVIDTLNIIEFDTQESLTHAN